MAMTRLSSKDSHWRPQETKILGDRAVRFRDVCVHEFSMGDVDDFAIYVADPIYQWQQSESGSWIMDHAETEPYWIHNTDMNTFGHRVKIMARLSEQNETFWRLKWGGQR